MDELTLRRAQRGDTGAFEQLVTPHEQLVWRVCWHYTHHTQDAQDCAQEVMVKAWRSIGAYRQSCSLETWLYRICMSVCIDFLRRKKRTVADSTDALSEGGFDLPDPAPQPEEAVIDRQSHQELRRVIDSLPEEMRTVVILYALEHQRYEDIARITGTPAGTVKSRLNRARKKLSELLEQSADPAVQHSEGRKS